MTEIRLWKISFLYPQTGFKMQEENSDPLKLCSNMCCCSIIKVVIDLMFELWDAPYPAQEMSVTQAYGDQERTKTTMTTKAIFASFHSLLMDFCWIRVDFLTWVPKRSTSLMAEENKEDTESLDVDVSWMTDLLS